MNKLVQWLEPYGITMKDITFSHKKYIVAKCINHVQYLMREKRRVYREHMLKINKSKGSDKSSQESVKTTKYENMINEYLSDFGNSYFVHLIRENISLFHDFGPKASEDIVRENKLKTAKAVANKGKANVVKEYDTEDDLKMDNGQPELYCDNVYDDTPYFLKNLIIDEDVQDPNEYKEYLREVLTYQYDCGEYVTDKLLNAIVSGKRRVYNGELAVIPLENRKYAYYKYDSAKLVWVFSETLSEAPLVPTKPDPEKNKWLQKCTETLIEKRTENFLKKIAENNPNVKYEDILDRYEILKRRNQSIQDYLEVLEDEYLTRKDMRDVLYIHHARKPSYAAHRLAKVEQSFIKQQSEQGTQIIQSPHMTLLYYILSIEDLQTQSACLCNFKARYCREAIPPSENKYWLYCKDTSAKLLPTCIYELALAAKKSTSEYRTAMYRICRSQGIINEDGNAFVDKHSGFFLRKIDDVEDVVFDDHDRIVFAAAPLESEDEPTKPEEMAQKESEDNTNQVLREIIKRFQSILGFTEDTLDVDFVVRFSRELIDNHTKLYYNNTSVAAYNKFLLDNRKDIAKEPTYDKYMKGVYVSMVGVTILVAIQTAVPRIVLKMNKSNPKNCVQKCIGSRDAYPFVEDESKKEGIDCIVCVSKLVATSFFVNPSLVNEKLFQTYYVKQVIKIREIKLRYDIARDYVAAIAPWGMPSGVNRKSVEEAIRDSGVIVHTATRWPDFMPPLIPFEIESPDTTNACTVNGSARVISYYIVKCIQDLVRNKTPLLSTLANVPFLQNACCNDRDNTGFTTPLQYFNEISKSSVFDNSIKCCVRISNLQRQYTFLSKPPAIYYIGKHPFSKYSSFDPSVTLKYRAIFHYAQFNTNRLPNDLMPLQKMLQKPEGYVETDSVEINVSRASDNLVKNRDMIFEEVMKIVRTRGQIQSYSNGPQEYDEDEENQEEVLHLRGEELLRQVDTKRILLANSILKPFYDSLNNGLSDNELTAFIQKLDTITGTPIMERIRFLQNCIYLITRFIPAVICHENTLRNNEADDDKIILPDHWDLFSHHKNQITNAVLSEWDLVFAKYHKNEFIEPLISSSETDDDNKTFLDKCKDIYIRCVESPPNASLPDLHSLVRYGLYKAINEYIKLACKSGDTFKWCISKTQRKGGLEEMEISQDLLDVNTTIWNMLKDVINHFASMNNTLVTDYSTIITRMRAIRTAEKKSVTDKFKAMSNEDRKVMNMFKKYKLEEWNVTDINKYGSRTFSGTGAVAGLAGVVTGDGSNVGAGDEGGDEALLGTDEQFEEHE